MFDKALERIYKEKAGKNELEMLKLSVDKSRAKSIFNDMRELFEVTVSELKSD
jgi:hypothetical protein